MPRTAIVLVSRSMSEMPRESLTRFCFQSAMRSTLSDVVLLFEPTRRRGEPLMKRIAAFLFVLLLTTTAFAAETRRYLVATKRPFAAGGFKALQDSVDT